MSQTDFIKYIRTPEFKALLNKYEEALNSGVDNFIDSEDLVDIAEYYHYSGMMEKAEEAADYCLEQYPDCATALYFKSRMELADHSNPDEAMRLLKRLPEDDDNVEKTFIEAEVKIVYGDSEGADKILRERYARLKSQVESQDGIYGVALDSEYDEESDEDWLLEDYSHFPLNTAMIFCDHCCFGYAEKWMKMMDKPLQDMLFEYWETWGRTYHMQERFKEAIVAWNKALDVDSYSFSAWIHLCDAQYQENLIDDAIQSAEFAQAISVDDPQPNMFLGALHLEKNNTAKGVEEFLKTIEKSGYDLAVMIRVGLAFYELGYKDAALNMMEMIKKPFEEADLMSECPPIVQEIIDKCISDEKNNQ